MGKYNPNWRGQVRAVLLLSSGLGALSGCVERRYTIRTEPPGATVIVNGEEMGPSPVSKSFVFYGQRKITLMLDGHQTKTLIQPISAPWWDNYITEFFTENMIPASLRDEREYTYKLEPFQLRAQGELRDSAESLRNESRVLPKIRRGGILAWFGFID
jgi:PEGA domain